MRRLLLAGVLLIGTSSILSAAEVRIDEHTLCPVALRHLTRGICRQLRNFLGSCRASLMSLMRGTRIRKNLHPEQNSLARASKCLLY